MTRGRPCRVLMTADAVGGVWSYALDLAGELAASGVETVLAVLGPEPAPARLKAARAAIPGLTIITTGLPLDWTAERPDQVVAAGRKIASLAEEVQADLVHLNSPALGGAARFPAPVVAVAHSCVATWWDAMRSGPLPPDLAWQTELTDRGYRSADAVLAPTHAFAEATARAYGIPVPAVVHNGRANPQSEARLPGDARLPADAPLRFAFAAGRLWDDGKNIAALDRAAARLSLPVLAAGPLAGPNGARIAVQHVRALGELDPAEMTDWLGAAAVFVSPARYEPFGLAVLEAAQAGCPLVLADIPTFRELWDGAAAFVPPDDDEAIAETIERAAGNRALGAAARERSGRYTAEAMSAGVLAAYERVLAQVSRPAREAAA